MGITHDPKPTSSRRLRFFGVAIAMLALTASACGGSDTSRPSLRAQTIDGVAIDIADTMDEDTVLWFWAPW